MPSLSNNHFFLLLILVLSLALFSSITHSLTTVSISETRNGTLICALAATTPLHSNRHSLNCTGFPATSSNASLPIPIDANASFSETVSGDDFVCGLINNRLTSVLSCWRFSPIDGSNSRRTRVYIGAALRSLDSGNSDVCAVVNSTGRLECWPRRRFRNLSLPTSATGFSRIAVGEGFVCWILNASVTCVGNNSRVVGREPSWGGYVEIASGVSHACAISAGDRSLNCWGDVENGNDNAPSGRFVSLALGENRSCGLRVNKTVVCWGQNGFVLPESLRQAEFISIEGKRRVFCGVLLVNSSLFCWGGGGASNNASLVFNAVLPGRCELESECRCGLLSGQGKYCGTRYTVCQPCWEERNSPPPELAPPVPGIAPGPQSPVEHRWSRRLVAFMVVGCVGCFCFLLVCGFFLFRYCSGRGCRIHDSGKLDEGSEPPGSLQLRRDRSRRVLEKRLSKVFSLGNNNVVQLEEFSLQVLLDATESFSENHKIGAGSFGTVYRGKLVDGREVAIKRAEASASSSSPTGIGAAKRQEVDKDHAFRREVEFLSRLNHKNLIRLLGFYEDDKEKVLVYEYLPNGTLHDHLHKHVVPVAEEDIDDQSNNYNNNNPLRSWPARIKTALDAARGVQYLHDFAVPSIIHRDIKSANILLDESWMAKVSDFGLSLMGPEDEESHLSLRAAGTVGYIDPEYFRLQKLTSKSDVYSFGVMLIELLSGHKAIHKNENGVPRNVVDYVVPYIVHDEIHRVLDRRVAPPTPYEIEAVAYVGYLAADCVTLEGKYRPTMTEIVGSLERALAACLARPELSRSTTESST